MFEFLLLQIKTRGRVTRRMAVSHTGHDYGSLSHESVFMTRPKLHRNASATWWSCTESGSSGGAWQELSLRPTVAVCASLLGTVLSFVITSNLISSNII